MGLGRRSTTLVAAMVLALASVAGPAAAQTAGDTAVVGGFSVEECVAAVAAATGADLDDDQRDLLEAMLADGATLEELLAQLFGDDPAFDPGDLPEGLTLEQLCTIYGVDTLPVVIESPPPGPPDGPDVDAEARPTTPTEVLGVSEQRMLPFTGSDLAVLVALAAALLGLGWLALRRTRDQAP